jgi:hypothetical protein
MAILGSYKREGIGKISKIDKAKPTTRNLKCVNLHLTSIAVASSPTCSLELHSPLKTAFTLQLGLEVFVAYLMMSLTNRCHLRE